MRLLRPFGAVLLVLASLAAAAASPAAAAVPQLKRYPYLTDLVGTAVTVNWATDRSATTGSASWGAVDGTGACAPTNAVAATKTGITVGSVAEYQWSAQLTLPSSGKYCYRVFLGTSDLLGADPSPAFTTQVPAGSTEPFSFAVFGDWGQGLSGGNPDEAAVLAQVAASGARFALTVGDNAYSGGSQTNYGDLQQTGANVSGVFGPQYWAGPGRSIPLFAAIGNHGFTSSATSPNTDLLNFPQDRAVAQSNGRYVKEQNCCVNGTTAAYYPSAWYAFDAGTARIYVLSADWADTNLGTGNVYSNDYAAHWAPGTPQYQWLQADLAAHPSSVKLAFFHYPMYSDQKAQKSDTALQGSASLEGLLAANHVGIAFTGHAHIYERNPSTLTGTITTYVTGGGGGAPQPVAELPCGAFDAYAIGWSATKSKGSKCGAAPVPDAASRVYHFLKVTVNGTTVTVTPTDELGRTFDVQTYDFSGIPPDTVIDSGPSGLTNATSAQLTFHATQPSATFACTIDAGAAAPCTSPVSYSGLTQGAHTFSVVATTTSGTDPIAATASWTVDSVAPTQPTGLTANAPSPSLVNLNWTASTDANGVTGYDITRDGAALASVSGATTSFADTTVAASTTYQYQVVARDAAGNSSPNAVVSVTTPGPTLPVFTDGFETGNLAAWTSATGLTVQGTLTHTGGFAAQANTTNGNTYAKKTLPGSYADGYSSIWFNLQSTSSQVNLLRHRTGADASLAYVFLSPTGALGVRNDIAATTTTSSTVVTGGWHQLELHTLVNGTASVIEVWLDGMRIDSLSSSTANLGTTPIGKIQIGDVQTGRTYNVAIDDVAFGIQRIGWTVDSVAPTQPTGLTANAPSPSLVNLNWTASTDANGVTGYDITRDGAALASVSGATTSFADTTVAASTTYQYQVVARDAAGNSSPNAVVSVTTPGPTLPVFTDGFETGNLAAWTSATGLTVQGTLTHTGGFAAAGEHHERQHVREEDVARLVRRRLLEHLVQPPKHLEPGEPAAPPHRRRCLARIRVLEPHRCARGAQRHRRHDHHQLHRGHWRMASARAAHAGQRHGERHRGLARRHAHRLTLVIDR